jgi:uncharacterized protein YggU (UPF0235/DUF167 family)
MTSSAVKPTADGCTLAIKVTPRASRVALEPARDGRLLVRVTAAPADGQANAAVYKLLAKSLRVPKSVLDISVGLSGREKTVDVRGISAAEIEQRLASYFEKQ